MQKKNYRFFNKIKPKYDFNFDDKQFIIRKSKIFSKITMEKFLITQTYHI